MALLFVAIPANTFNTVIRAMVTRRSDYLLRVSNPIESNSNVTRAGEGDSSVTFAVKRGTEKGVYCCHEHGERQVDVARKIQSSRWRSFPRESQAKQV